MATLEDKPFDQAVTVHGARAGLVRNIGSVREAAEWLLYKWPSEDRRRKPLERRARPASRHCRAKAMTATARQAFRDAAEEAGILIGDVDRVPKPGKVVKRSR